MRKPPKTSRTKGPLWDPEQNTVLAPICAMLRSETPERKNGPSILSVFELLKNVSKGAAPWFCYRMGQATYFKSK